MGDEDGVEPEAPGNERIGVPALPGLAAPARPDVVGLPFGVGAAPPGPFHSPGTPGIVVPCGAPGVVCEGVEDGTPVDTPEAGGTLAGDAYSGCASTADATGTGNGPPSLAASGPGTDAVDGAGAAGRFTGALRLDSGSGDFAKSVVSHSDALVHQSLYQ